MLLQLQIMFLDKFKHSLLVSKILLELIFVIVNFHNYCVTRKTVF